MVKFIPGHRTDRQLLLLVIACSLGLYLRTMAPELLTGDSGEFQFAAWRFGLAHPTGYPLYLLLGGLWQHGLALVGVNPATALTIFTAVIGAVAVGLLYLVMVDWLAGPLPVRRAAALFTAALFAVNPTFWSQNLITEVYTLHVFFILCILRAFQQVAENATPPTEVPLAYPLGSSQPFLLLAFFVGLSLTHHGMTLFLLPGLFVSLWLVDRHWWQSWPRLVGMLFVMALPLLLYLYIPLRSGPAASPWYHQMLGATRLDLYQNNWPAFFAFITGRSISVGFHTVGQAWAELGQAWLLWRLHFQWPGLVLMVVGLFVLVRQRRGAVLVITLSYAVLQQGFNLFYAIGDILVYYIPLYLVGAMWAGFAANAIGNGMRTAPTGESEGKGSPLGLYLVLLLFLLPLQLAATYFSQLDQAHNHAARQLWEPILAAQPPANAILVSNDRDEMVPLFYFQAVEQRAVGHTGLFPLLAPDARFADIGATLETALTQGQGQPVYLIKPMPGLDVKFALEQATAPLVRVQGLAAQTAPQVPVQQTLGPLQLLGYDWQTTGQMVHLQLHWRVQAKLPADYTTTVQLFADKEEKLAQDDQPPGGVYYPTSLWKPGEMLVEQHTLSLPAGRKPVTFLVGMYTGPTFTPLAPPLTLKLVAK